MIAKDNIFREYDIRGVVGGDFDAAFARALGQAYAKFLTLAAAQQATEYEIPTGQGNLVVGVGKDCRLSSDELTAALIEGIRDGGVDVLETGLGPTPQLYFSVFSQNLAGGIQVTGSHNPSDQNGFKMMVGKKTLSGKDIQTLRTGVKQLPEKVAKRGNVKSFDARSVYISDLIARSKPHMNAARKVKVVVDGGNGVGGLVGPAVLRGLGCEVIELYTEPDGRFPNHHPDPTVLENIRDLQKKVLETKAHLGIAWDGDADRIGVVDEKGEPIFGDMLLLIFGRQLLREIKKPIIIGDVKCSELLFSDLRKRGAEAVMWKTGHSLIKAKLRELNGHLAGEMSGHIFFKHRFFGFDDALHAAARLVEIVSHAEGPVSSFLADLPAVVSTPEIRRDCPESLKFLIANKAKDCFADYEVVTLDGVRIQFPHGWGLVRASNTQSVLVLRFEADTQENLQTYQRIVENKIEELESQNRPS